MSDEQQEPARRRGVPVPLFIVGILATVVATGSVVWSARLKVMGPVPPTPAVTIPETSSVEPTAVAAADETLAPIPNPGTPAPAPAPEPPSAPAPDPTTLRSPAYVTFVASAGAKGYSVTVDYVQYLTGQAATDAAKEEDEESPPPNGFFIRNESAKLRTLTLPKTASVTLLGWGNTSPTNPQALPAEQFFRVMPGGPEPDEAYSKGLYYLTVKGGTTITAIEQIYLP